MNYAILLTDLVDSTKMAQALGDEAMAHIWAAHDRLARDLLPTHRGREYERTDGFLILFEDVQDASAYAVAYHRALRTADPPLLARAALHSGPLTLIHNAPADVARGAKAVEVDGLAKATATRVLSLAIGGQTLLTPPARAALGQTPLRVASHGHWRMRGADAPVELFEIGDSDAPFIPPQDGPGVYLVVQREDLWIPVREIRHGLPRERDAFVGRHAALTSLTRRIEDGAPLVTVLGIGGTGKTRLVTRFGWTCLGDWPGGVWFCDLSEARNEDGIAAVVAAALGVQLGKDDPVFQLGHALASRGRCLVILDNFEQVAHHAADTLGRWLDRAHGAVFIVTTREVLGLPGEVVLALAPLDVDEAVYLFTTRAAQARQGFTLTVADLSHTQALVRLLDGLPLAIELAAAQVRTMTPETIRARMGERLDLLTSTGARHTRQATLRGALDWSWDLLSTDERQALAQLSVFEGGFALDGAEAVLALEALWPVDALQALVDKSLVRALGDGRFDLLVSVQAYAAEKLAALGGLREAQERHGRFFALHGDEPALAALDTHGGATLQQALAVDLDNLVVAVRRATARADAEVAVSAVRAAWRVLEVRGPLRLAAELADAVLALPHLPRRLAGPVRVLRATALRVLGKGEEALPHFEAALEDARSAGDRRLEASAHAGIAVVYQDLSRHDDARTAYETALALAREVGARAAQAVNLRNLCDLHRDQGRPLEARACLDEALSLFRALGDRRMEGSCLASLGGLQWDQHRLEACQASQETALALHRECGDRRAEGVALGNLGEVHRVQGRLDDARAHYVAAVAVHRQVGNARMEGMVLSDLGNLEIVQGRLDEARKHYETALRLQRDAGHRRHECLTLANLGELNLIEGRRAEARAYLDAALALCRQTHFRRVEAFVLDTFGRLDLQEGRIEEARVPLGGALALAQAIPDRELEGAILGRLGTVDLRQGRFEEARARYDEGMTILRGLRNPIELAKLLLGRVELWQATGERARAQADLREAESLMASLQAGPSSDLGQLLAERRAAWGAGSDGALP